MSDTPATPSPRSDAVRKELNRLNRALVLCTDQAECDAMEAKIAELERAP